MRDRLELFMRQQGFTSGKFAEIMEVRPSNISHILAGRNNPNFEFVAKMLRRFPELNPDWLINGQGEILRGATVNDNITNVTETIPPIVTTQANKAAGDIVTNVTAEYPEIKEDAEDVVKNEGATIVDAPKEKRERKVIIFYDDMTCDIFESK